MTPQGTKNRRFGSQNPPKIDPGTEKSIFRDFVKILLFLKRQHDSQGPALPKINKNRPSAPSSGGRRVQRRLEATFPAFSIFFDSIARWAYRRLSIFPSSQLFSTVLLFVRAFLDAAFGGAKG